MPGYNPKVHHRRSMRLKRYDYSSAGFYFVTLCVHDHHCLFGTIGGATCRSPGINAVPYEMKLNQYGSIVRDVWLKTPVIRQEILLDEFVVMPNHFHAIVRIKKGKDQHINQQTIIVAGDQPVAPTGPKTCSVGALIAGFKSAVTKRINEIRHTPGADVWQRNYYEHIIRDQNALSKIRQYIMNNPKTWTTDRLNPQRQASAENVIAVIENPIE